MSDRSPGERLRGLSSLVGNTPLLAIECEYRGARRVVHAKAEHLNLTGSIKDRMALHILRQGYARGRARARRHASSRPPAATPASPSPRSAARSATRSPSSCRTG